LEEAFPSPPAGLSLRGGAKDLFMINKFLTLN